MRATFLSCLAYLGSWIASRSTANVYLLSWICFYTFILISLCVMWVCMCVYFTWAKGIRMSFHKFNYCGFRKIHMWIVEFYFMTMIIVEMASVISFYFHNVCNSKNAFSEIQNECLLIVWRFIAIENTVKDVILIGSNRNDFCFIRICTHIRHHMYTLILQFAVSFDNKFLENCFICFGNRQAAVRMLINDLYRFSSQIRLQQSQEIPTLSHRWSMNFRLSLTLLLFVSL